MKLKDAKMLSDDPENFDPDSLIPKEVRSKWVVEPRGRTSFGDYWVLFLPLVFFLIIDPELGEKNFGILCFAIVGTLLAFCGIKWSDHVKHRKLCAELKRVIEAQAKQSL